MAVWAERALSSMWATSSKWFNAVWISVAKNVSEGILVLTGTERSATRG